MCVIVLAWLLRCSVAESDGWGAMKGSFLGEGNQKREKGIKVELRFHQEAMRLFYKQHIRAFISLRENQPRRRCSYDEAGGEQREGIMDNLRHTSSKTNVFVPEQNFLCEPDQITAQERHAHALRSTGMGKFVDRQVRSSGFIDRWACLIKWLSHSNKVVWKLILFMSLL